MVELCELAEHGSRLVSVLGHGTGQSLGCCATDGLLMMGDVSDQQGAELRDQLQPQRLPKPEGNKPTFSSTCKKENPKQLHFISK